MRLFIVGMHRSGTSALAQLVERLGFFAGHEEDFHPSTAHDPSGYHEHRLVWGVNEEALAVLGRAWDDPWPLDWSTLDPIRRELLHASRAEAIAELDRHGPWMVKDPRLCLTLPLWRQNISPVCLLVHRDPLEVARSLAARSGLPVFWGIALWEVYQRAALRDSLGLQRIFVRFGDFAANPSGFSRRLAEHLRGTFPEVAIRDHSEVARAFDSRLVRQRSTEGSSELFLNSAQRSLVAALDHASTGSADVGAELEAAGSEPPSAPAQEVLAFVAAQRSRIGGLERRIREISDWNEQLWRRSRGDTTWRSSLAEWFRSPAQLLAGRRIRP